MSIQLKGKKKREGEGDEHDDCVAPQSDVVREDHLFPYDWRLSLRAECGVLSLREGRQCLFPQNELRVEKMRKRGVPVRTSSRSQQQILLTTMQYTYSATFHERSSAGLGSTY